MSAHLRRWYHINHQINTKGVHGDMLRTIKNFLADERGQASTEYAVIIGVIALALIGALFLFREKLQDVFTRAGEELDTIEDVSGS